MRPFLKAGQKMPAGAAAILASAIGLMQCAAQDARPDATGDGEAAGEPATEESKDPSPEEIRATIAALGSDDFRERELATQKVWKLGRLAEPYLKEAVRSDNTELRYRGRKILDEFELGLYPDTPNEVRVLVNRYRKGDPLARESAVEELARLGQTELLVKLVKRERDPAMRTTVANLIARNVSDVAPQQILDGEIGKAEELLKLAALNSRGMRDYAAFLLLTGKLDAAIEAQLKVAGDTPVDTELLAWMQRARGDLEEAAATFGLVGNKAAERHTRAAKGDLAAYARNFADPSRRTADTLAFSAAIARMGGDADEFEKIMADLELYAKAMPDEVDRCLNAMILNGEAKRAFKLAGELAKSELVDMELWRYDFDAAFAALGTKAKQAPYDDWLATFQKGFKVRAEEEVADAIYPAGQFASACMLTGQEAEAERIFRAVARLLEAENASILPLVRWEVAVGLDELAREHAVKAMELEIEGDVVRSLYPMRADYAWLTTACWEFLRENHPDDSQEATLRRLGALFEFDEAGHPKADATPILEAVLAAADLAKDPESRKELLRIVAELGRLHEKWELAAKANGAWLPLIGAEAAAYHHMRYGETLMNAERFADAASAYEKAWQLGRSQPSALYLKATALEKAGDAEGAAELKRRVNLMALGDTTKRHFIATAMWGNEEIDAARQQDQLILRLASPLEGVHAEALRRNYVDASSNGTAAEAAEALERYMLSKLRPVNASSLLSRRAALAYLANHGALSAKAAILADDAPQAIARMRRLQDLNPSDSSMLEDMHQLLKDAGHEAEADTMFEITYAVSKDTVERFPGRGQHHNNHAWLLSRCAKKLDEALVHAERAVGMEPKNGAFLDTLAEVHFQRGDRAKAVEFSEKAIAVLGDDAQVKRQLERFKTGKPTDR